MFMIFVSQENFIMKFEKSSNFKLLKWLFSFNYYSLSMWIIRTFLLWEFTHLDIVPKLLLLLFLLSLIFFLSFIFLFLFILSIFQSWLPWIPLNFLFHKINYHPYYSNSNTNHEQQHIIISYSPFIRCIFFSLFA